jgi:uncharacterized protein YbjT (DUF2867 family)
MKNVIILGASGNIAKHVTDILSSNKDVSLTLFLRNSRRLKGINITQCRIIEGDVLNYTQLKKAVHGQDIVYVNLAGDLEAMANNIVKAMQETGVKRIIAISSIGIYETPVRSVLKPYRKLADIIETSGLDFTILRPTWFSSTDEVDYELTKKGDPEKGSVISQKSLASFITKIIESPEKYVGENLGISKPNS